jgi:ABC-2 type transport system permease protein
VECLLIPIVTSPKGSPTKITPAPWYYSPLLSPSNKHVISSNLNRVKADFVSSIDIVGNQELVHKTVILATSAYSLVSQTPVEISLSSTNNPPDRRLFRDPSQPVGVLLEGTFTSVFKNRMVESFGAKASEVKVESMPTKMVVFSNGNLIANQFRMSNGGPEYMPLGYDRYSQQTFGNKDLIMNTVNYLCDDEGLMNLRSRVFKIRLLDKVRVKEGKLIWQIVNVIIPLLIISLFGAVYVYIRRRKYQW